jgi:hypothetical protein
MLLLINTGELNKLCVTLNELAIDSLPLDNWLFVFQKDQGFDTQKVFLDDTSTHIERYNLFELTEGVTITFTTFGDHSYKVYQMPDRNDTDETRGFLVEQGKAKIRSIEEEIPTYTPDLEAPVYTPQ